MLFMDGYRLEAYGATVDLVSCGSQHPSLWFGKSLAKVWQTALMLQAHLEHRNCFANHGDFFVTFKSQARENDEQAMRPPPSFVLVQSL